MDKRLMKLESVPESSRRTTGREKQVESDELFEVEDTLESAVGEISGDVPRAHAAVTEFTAELDEVGLKRAERRGGEVDPIDLAEAHIGSAALEIKNVARNMRDSFKRLRKAKRTLLLVVGIDLAAAGGMYEAGKHRAFEGIDARLDQQSQEVAKDVDRFIDTATAIQDVRKEDIRNGVRKIVRTELETERGLHQLEQEFDRLVSEERAKMEPEKKEDAPTMRTVEKPKTAKKVAVKPKAKG